MMVTLIPPHFIFQQLHVILFLVVVAVLIFMFFCFRERGNSSSSNNGARKNNKQRRPSLLKRKALRITYIVMGASAIIFGSLPYIYLSTSSDGGGGGGGGNSNIEVAVEKWLNSTSAAAAAVQNKLKNGQRRRSCPAEYCRNITNWPLCFEKFGYDGWLNTDCGIKKIKEISQCPEKCRDRPKKWEMCLKKSCYPLDSVKGYGLAGGNKWCVRKPGAACEMPNKQCCWKEPYNMFCYPRPSGKKGRDVPICLSPSDKYCSLQEGKSCGGKDSVKCCPPLKCLPDLSRSGKSTCIDCHGLGSKCRTDEGAKRCCPSLKCQKERCYPENCNNNTECGFWPNVCINNECFLDTQPRNGPCNEDKHCQGNMVCHLQQGRHTCQEKCTNNSTTCTHCHNNADCGQSPNICIHNECFPGSQPTGWPCEEDEHCKGYTICVLSTCQGLCANNSNCPLSNVCVFRKCYPRKQPPGGSCDDDDDCGQDNPCDMNYNKCGRYCSEHFGCSKALTYDNGKGKTMPYRLFLPISQLNSSKATLYPLIVFMHGGPKSGTDNIKHVTAHNLGGLIDATQTEDYASILLAPHLPKKKWNPAKNPKDLTPEIIQYVIDHYPVDINRIYITGNSHGAFGTTRYVVDNPDLFAAAIPISGAIGIADLDSQDFSRAESIRHVPFWLFHGDNDTAINVKTSRNFVAALRHVGGNVKYDEIPGGKHAIWSPIWEDWRNGSRGVYKWLFSQSRSSVNKDPPKIFHALT